MPHPHPHSPLRLKLRTVKVAEGKVGIPVCSVSGGFMKTVTALASLERKVLTFPELKQPKRFGAEGIQNADF